jgi:hypothetical protein
VDDESLFVKDGLIRLWEHRIRGNHWAIHMISDSWTTQKEYVQKFVWNISIIFMYGLVHYHQNTKQFFVGFLVTKDAKTLKQHQRFFLECIDFISEDVNVKVNCVTSNPIALWPSTEYFSRQKSSPTK